MRRTGVEVGCAQHVALTARHIAGLRVGWRTGLALPSRILLAHEAEFAVRLAVARVAGVAQRLVGTVALAQRVEKLSQLRLQRAAHRGVAERREWHQVAVELAHPVDQSVAAGVADQHVASRTAVGTVFVAGVGVGAGVEPARRAMVVVGIDQVVTPAAVHRVAAGAAHQPVVTEVAEDAVVAVAADRRAAGNERSFQIEVEHEAIDAAHGLVLEVLRKFASAQFAVAQYVAGVRRSCVNGRQRFGTRDAVVAPATVQCVVAPAAEDQVVGLRRPEQRVERLAEGSQVDRLLQLVLDVDRRALDTARRADEHIGGNGGSDAIECFRQPVAAGQNAAVVAEHAVVARSTGDPVVAPATDQIVVLALAKQQVAAGHAVNEVIARFTVQLIARTDVAGGRRSERHTAWCVVEQFGSTHDDLVGRTRTRVVVVVVEAQERAAVGAADADDAEDVAVVAEDHVGVACMAVGGNVASVVARHISAGAAEDQVGAIGTQSWRGQTEQTGAAADDVVLAKVAEDHVGAAVAFDVVVAVVGALEARGHRQPGGTTADGSDVYGRAEDQRLSNGW